MTAIRLMDLALKIAPKLHKMPIYEAIIHACNGVIDGTNDIDRAVVHVWKNPLSSLENFLAYYYNVIIDDHPRGADRKITPEQFALIVDLFEEHRSDIKEWLQLYDVWQKVYTVKVECDRTTFDDYCGSIPIPDTKLRQASEMISDFLIQNLYA
jgi:hypothetical protein